MGLRKSVFDELAKPEAERSIIPYGTIQYFLVPTGLVVHQLDHVETWRVTPIDVRTTEVTTGIFAPDPPDDRARRYWIKNLDLLLQVTGTEDFPRMEKIQRSLDSSAVPDVVDGRNEPALVYLQPGDRRSTRIVARELVAVTWAICLDAPASEPPGSGLADGGRVLEQGSERGDEVAWIGDGRTVETLRIREDESGMRALLGRPTTGDDGEVDDVLGSQGPPFGCGVREELFVGCASQRGARGDRDDVPPIGGEGVCDCWRVHLVEQQPHRSSNARWRRHAASASSARCARSASIASISSVNSA